MNPRPNPRTRGTIVRRVDTFGTTPGSVYLNRIDIRPMHIDAAGAVLIEEPDEASPERIMELLGITPAERVRDGAANLTPFTGVTLSVYSDGFSSSGRSGVEALCSRAWFDLRRSASGPYWIQRTGDEIAQILLDRDGYEIETDAAEGGVPSLRTTRALLGRLADLLERDRAFRGLAAAAVGGAALETLAGWRGR